MSTIIVILSCALIFVAHMWMLLFHRQILGSEKHDKSEDFLYSRSNQVLSFSIILIYHFFSSIRRILLEIGDWPVSLPQNLNLGLRFLDLFSLPPHRLTLLGGFFVFAGGFILRKWAMTNLGRLFTFEIGIRANHKMIHSGPYQYIRHPSYTGYGVMLIGVGLANASLGFIIFTLTPTLCFFLVRIYLEEKMLLKHFGKPYADYQRRTKKLIPYLF